MKKDKAKKRQKKTRLPLGVGCLALFGLVGSIISLSLLGLLEARKRGVHVSWMDTKEFPKALTSLSTNQALVWLAFALLNLIASVGLFARKAWAWWLFVLLTLSAGAFNVYDSVTQHLPLRYGSLAFQVVILVYMCLPGVRRSFR